MVRRGDFLRVPFFLRKNGHESIDSLYTLREFALVGAFGAVEKVEDGDGDDGVDDRAEDLVEPQQLDAGYADETAVDEEQQDAVEDGETEVDEDAGGEIFDVDLKADAGGEVADEGLGEAVDADGLGRDGVLKQADSGSGKRSGDGRAARDAEEDRYDQGEIEDHEAGERPWQQRLQDDGGDRHEQGHSRVEAVLFEFASGGVAVGRHGLSLSCEL